SLRIRVRASRAPRLRSNSSPDPAPLAWRLPVVHDELSMAAIDGLLALVEIQKASGLVLVTGEVPALLVGGATRPLSMPALAPALFDALIAEVLDPEQRERLREQATVEL